MVIVCARRRAVPNGRDSNRLVVIRGANPISGVDLSRRRPERQRGSRDLRRSNSWHRGFRNVMATSSYEKEGNEDCQKDGNTLMFQNRLLSGNLQQGTPIMPLLGQEFFRSCVCKSAGKVLSDFSESFYLLVAFVVINRFLKALNGFGRAVYASNLELLSAALVV